jgi:hypothetical protein
VAVTRGRTIVVGVVTCALVAAVIYLRDPRWLIDITSGLGGWEIADDGTRYRWAGSHASFFVPSDARRIVLPVRAPFDTPSDWPITATISLDDRDVERLTLREDGWRRVVVTLPPRGSRRVRRVDIRLDRTRRENQGVQIGEVEIGR